MQIQTQMRLAIIGAGIGGLTTAVALKRKGIDATVYEAAPQIKAVGAGLAFSANAMKGYNVIGMKDAVAAKGQFLNAFVIYDENGRPITYTDSQALSAEFGQDNFTIHRADLHEVLMSALSPEQVVTGRRVECVHQHADEVTVFFSDGSSVVVDLLIAADGINSPIRKQLFPASKIRHAGYTCWRGITHSPSIALKQSSETWSAAGRFGLVPLPNQRIYWFACLNAPPSDLTMSSYGAEDLLKHFGHLHQPIPEVIAQTPKESIIWGDISDLEPLETFTSGRVLLLGDAAHATTPNLGQGACQAVEDAVVIAAELAENKDWKTAFGHYNKRRVARTRYIVNTSRQVGAMAQLSGKLSIGLRNAMLRLMPDAVAKKQLRKLYQVDF